MRRREFITLLGSAAAWPAVAQSHPPMPIIGVLAPGSPATFGHLFTAFHEGLGEAGYVQNKNVIVEYRWAEGEYDRLPRLAANLVSRSVHVIVPVGGTAAALAAKTATSTVPIVFEIGGDPVHAGLVASLNRPGGNVTGVSLFTVELDAKRLELLRDLVPSASAFAMLVNPDNANRPVEVRLVKAAAEALGRDVHFLEARSEAEFEPAFTELTRRGIGALFVMADTFFVTRRAQLAALAAKYRVPAIYGVREHAAAGGLISYGASLANNFRQVGVYTGRVLKGAKPADLPVMQPAKFELVINLRTAKTLGVTVPMTLLTRADEVIE